MIEGKEVDAGVVMDQEIARQKVVIVLPVTHSVHRVWSREIQLRQIQIASHSAMLVPPATFAAIQFATGKLLVAAPQEDQATVVGTEQIAIAADVALLWVTVTPHLECTHLEHHLRLLRLLVDHLPATIIWVEMVLVGVVSITAMARRLGWAAWVEGIVVVV